MQEAATAARRRASGLAADALFAAEEGGEEAQPSPADADAGDEDDAERQYRLELGRELQVRAPSLLCSNCSLHTARALPFCCVSTDRGRTVRTPCMVLLATLVMSSDGVSVSAGSKGVRGRACPTKRCNAQ